MVSFEQRLRARATALGRQGLLAEAATSWEVLTVLKSDEREYRDRLNETRQLIEAAVPDRLQRGTQALRRGDLDGAATQYLSALALQPDNAVAADALRNIERERNRRNFLGKPSRLTLARRSTTDGQMSTGLAARLSERNDVEHASILGAQGEFDDAIAILERHLAVDRRDRSACRLLADMYYQKAEKQLPRDRSAAIELFGKSSRLDPAHARATSRFKLLNSGRPVARAPLTAPASDVCSTVG